MSFEQNKHTMTTVCNSAIIRLSFLRANTVKEKVLTHILLLLFSENCKLLLLLLSLFGLAIYYFKILVL